MDLVTPHPDPPAQPAVQPTLALATGIPEAQVGSSALPTLQPLEPVFALATAQSSTRIRDTQVGTSAARNRPEPEPTARDILQSIHDLGRRFDLLATNERVDMLDARLDTVEERLDHRLNALEQRLSTSDEQWKATSSSLGNLYMGLRKHKEDLAVHRPRENISRGRQSQQQIVALPPQSLQHAGSSNEHLAISQLGRLSTHGWTESPIIRLPQNSGRSISAAQISVASQSLLSSPPSSRYSSAPPGTSGE
jgi:hypothetical protein